jgi:hypothetical protein
MANQAQELMDMVSRFKVNGADKTILNFELKRQIGPHTSAAENNNFQFETRNYISGKGFNPNGKGGDRSCNGTTKYITDSNKRLNMDVIAKEGFEEF